MQTLRFLLNDALIELTEVDPTLTVLRWLREHAGLHGTKEGCAEGDCGACSVVIGEPAGAGNMRWRAVNACILFLPALDGCQLLTVEHLKQADGRLHPVQQAMVEQHASQCGFCTPGFVMSLFALYLHRGEARPSHRQVCDTLAGNLCRCTGYRPITDAAAAMWDIPWQEPLLEREAEIAARLHALRHDEPLVLEYEGRRYAAPTSLAQLDELLAADPDATLLAGATDVGLWVTKQHRDLASVIWLGRVAELKGFEETDTAIDIGAMVTHSEILPVLKRCFPDFGELLRRFGSTLIRNSSTVGGNVANGSPIGDSMPALIALGATVVLRGPGGRRELALEDLYLDYQKQDRARGEYVERVRIPKLVENEHFACYKLSKRFDSDISAVCAAFKIRLENGIASEVRTGFGGVAAVPARAHKTEAALRGQPWNAASLAVAEQVLENEFTPLTDMRATARYRSVVSARLLHKFFIETSQPGAATRVLEDEAAA